MRRSLVLSLCVLTSPIVSAQARPAPTPEVQKLAFFVGNFSSEGTMTVGSTSGRFAAKDRATWANGGYFVENRSEYTTPFGPGSLLEVLGYDPTRKVYTHDSFDSSGRRISSTGTLDGSVWTWTSDDGRSRHIITVVSPTSFRFKTEFTLDGKTWATLVEGTSTKDASAAIGSD